LSRRCVGVGWFPIAAKSGRYGKPALRLLADREAGYPGRVPSVSDSTTCSPSRSTVISIVCPTCV
jgi:hypothetical protein